MQEQHLFEYAIVRIVPRVEREEFVNAGILLYCPKRRFLKAGLLVREPLIRNLQPDIDLETVCANLRSLELICAGGRQAGPIGAFDMASRFRWLTAMRSTVVQTSRVHPGFCDDPEKKLQHLLEQLVA